MRVGLRRWSWHDEYLGFDGGEWISKAKRCSRIIFSFIIFKMKLFKQDKDKGKDGRMDLSRSNSNRFITNGISFTSKY